MHEFSAVDGFVEISESLVDMINYLANEPSVGLFYVQQHTQNAVPNVIMLKKKVSEKFCETALHAEDLEDSIAMVSSMKECGSHIVQGMIGDISKTLDIVSVKEPRRGDMNSQGSSFSTSWGPSSFSSHQESGRSGNFISTVLKSAKEKASNLKWPPLDLLNPRPSRYEGTPTATSTCSSLQLKGNNLPVSNRIKTNNVEKHLSEDPLLLTEECDEFKVYRETKLRQFLQNNRQQCE